MATPAKKTAPKKVVLKKRANIADRKSIQVDMSFKKEYENLKELTEQLEKQNVELKERVKLAENLIAHGERFQPEPPAMTGYSYVEKPCPKCQILDILGTLSEAQVNSVLRDVHIEVDYSRTARMNMLEDELKKAAYKRDAFREDVNSHETYK